APLFASPNGVPGSVTGLAGSITNLPPRIAQQIAAKPSAFYTNLHTAAFPGGALRGQLFDGGGSPHDGTQPAPSTASDVARAPRSSRAPARPAAASPSPGPPSGPPCGAASGTPSSPPTPARHSGSPPTAAPSPARWSPRPPTAPATSPNWTWTPHRPAAAVCC